MLRRDIPNSATLDAIKNFSTQASREPVKTLSLTDFDSIAPGDPIPDPSIDESHYIAFENAVNDIYSNVGASGQVATPAAGTSTPVPLAGLRPADTPTTEVKATPAGAPADVTPTPEPTKAATPSAPPAATPTARPTEG